ncbi:unnamed protein product [Symbiodinium sp. CCMP2592]|nr:unnamed protein product [Symbiodinium sp. CCMP2592]
MAAFSEPSLHQFVALPPASALPDPPPQSAALSDSMPLMLRPEIRDLAAQDAWQPLAHHLRALHSRSGLQHCPVCHQWFTRTPDILLHLNKQHPLTALQTSMRADWLTARTAAARSPCSWCRQTVSYKTQHVAACPVLQQVITLRILIRHELGLPSVAQTKEAQAELLLLQCWGEPMDLDFTSKRQNEQEDTEEPEKERDAKWARPESKGGFGRGGQGKGNQNPGGQPNKGTDGERPVGKDTEAMVWMLGKLPLRHEDQMGIDRTQHGFVMFFKRESALSLVLLFEQKQEKINEIALPLRTFLFHTMLETFIKRIKDTAKNTGLLQTDNAELLIPFLVYNPETKTLSPRQDQEASRSGIELRRPLGKTSNLRALANSAVWQLVGGSLRPERMGRSALANEVAKGSCAQQPHHLSFCDVLPPLGEPPIMLSSSLWNQVIWTSAMQSVVQRITQQAPTPDLWTVLQ